MERAEEIQWNYHGMSVHPSFIIAGEQCCGLIYQVNEVNPLLDLSRFQKTLHTIWI